MPKIEYGIQMFSLRDLAEQDLKAALTKVAEQGYRYVEFAGFFGHSAEDVRSWLDELGLKCSGTHTGLGELQDHNIEQTIKYHKTIGCDNIIVPGLDWSDRENAENNIKMLEKARVRLEKEGIRLGYHNHSREFLETGYGMLIEKEIIENTKVELEIDTFWTFNAGLNTIDFLEKNKGRISVIHLKDGIPSAPDCKTYDKVYDGVSGKSIGSGAAPVKDVRDWALKNNVLMVIESEGLNPTGPEEVGRCIKYLRSLE